SSDLAGLVPAVDVAEPADSGPPAVAVQDHPDVPGGVRVAELALQPTFVEPVEGITEPHGTQPFAAVEGRGPAVRRAPEGGPPARRRAAARSRGPGAAGGRSPCAARPARGRRARGGSGRRGKGSSPQG